MKLKLLISLLLLLPVITFAQGSVELGDSGEFSQLTVNKASFGENAIVADSKNNVYICYTDYGTACNDGLADLSPMRSIIMKFDGTNWSRIGNGPITPMSEISPSMAVDNHDTLYIAAINGARPAVHKYNGSQWVPVGMPSDFPSSANRCSPLWLVFDKFNTPYLAYVNENDYRVEAFKFNGNSWQSLPNCSLSTGGAYAFGFAIAKNDSVLHVSGQLGTNLYVKKFNTVLNDWELVGGAPLPKLPTDSSATDSKLYFNSQKQLHVVWANMLNQRNSIVYKFNGSSWDRVVNVPGVVYSNHLYFGAADTLYIVSNTNNEVFGFQMYQWDGTQVRNITQEANFINRLIGRLLFLPTGNVYGFFIHFETEKGEFRRFANNQWALLKGKSKAGLSEGRVEQTTVKVDKGGTPFVVYKDVLAGGKAIMKRFDADSNQWFTVGNGSISDGVANSIQMALDTSGTPYAVFADGTDNFKTTMKRFDGSNWVNVGTPAFSTGSVSNVTMAVSTSGVPYASYSDFAVSGKATVKRYTGSWEFVGSEGFSTGKANYTSLTLGKTGTPYVIYTDESDNNKAYVKAFVGSNWSTAGAAALSPAAASHTSMAIDEDSGTPYALYTNTNNGKLTVARYNGVDAWNNVGAPSFTDSIGGGGSIGLDRAGTPYVIFPDPAYNNKASIMRYDVTGWSYFGERGFSAGGIAFPSLTFDSSNNLIVVYTSTQAFARKFTTGGGSVGISEAQIEKVANKIYPNPNEIGLLKIEIPFEDIGKSFSIYNLQGKACYTDKLTAEYNEIPLDKFKQGIYLIKVEGSPKVFKLWIK